MDVNQADLLGEIARDAALERSDFLVRATEQLERFLEANAARIAEIGGLTLIDDDPDYLSIAPDLTFRSRTRYLDERPASGSARPRSSSRRRSWSSSTTRPTSTRRSPRRPARPPASSPSRPPPTTCSSVAGIAPGRDDRDRRRRTRRLPTSGRPASRPLEADDDESAAQRLYDLALDVPGAEPAREARLLEQFEEAVAQLAGYLGDLIIIDDDDERLTLTGAGGFPAEVLPEGEEERGGPLATPDELVEYYDPTDVFGDLADAARRGLPVGRRPSCDDGRRRRTTTTATTTTTTMMTTTTTRATKKG